jgi:hypothetical protein
MEKRILIAAIVSAVFMTWYAQSVLHWTTPTEKRSTTAASVLERALTPRTVWPPCPQLGLGFSTSNQ